MLSFSMLPPWITALHDQAMNVADDADVARRHGQKSPLLSDSLPE